MLRTAVKTIAIVDPATSAGIDRRNCSERTRIGRLPSIANARPSEAGVQTPCALRAVREFFDE
jgi:hypothetical protein